MFDKSKSIFFKESLYYKDTESKEIPIEYKRKIEQHQFSLLPILPFERYFGVNIQFKNNLTKNSDRNITYEVNVKITVCNDDPNYYQFTFDKNNVSINDRKPDFIAEELSIKFMEAIYPIQIRIDSLQRKHGNISNHEEILKKWDQIQNELMSKYQGEIFDNLLHAFDKKIQNIDLLNQSMNKDMFWSLIFHPVLGEYNADLLRTQEMFFPLGANSITNFEGTQKIFPYITDYDTIKIFYNGKNQHEDTISTCFDIDYDSKAIKYMTAEYDGKKGTEQILFSAYEIDAPFIKKPLQISNNELSETKKKKSFWSFLDV